MCHLSKAIITKLQLGINFAMPQIWIVVMLSCSQMDSVK